MKERSNFSEPQEIQPNPKPAAVEGNVESRNAGAALSDDALKQVNAAGAACVPTMDVEVLLGRHARPSDNGERRP